MTVFVVSFVNQALILNCFSDGRAEDAARGLAHFWMTDSCASMVKDVGERTFWDSEPWKFDHQLLHSAFEPRHWCFTWYPVCSECKRAGVRSRILQIEIFIYCTQKENRFKATFSKVRSLTGPTHAVLNSTTVHTTAHTMYCEGRGNICHIFPRVWVTVSGAYAETLPTYEQRLTSQGAHSTLIQGFSNVRGWWRNPQFNLLRAWPLVPVCDSVNNYRYGLIWK